VPDKLVGAGTRNTFDGKGERGMFDGTQVPHVDKLFNERVLVADSTLFMTASTPDAL
jgi:hypothetical protein